MPRHTFSFSPEFLDTLRRRIRRAFQEVEIDQFSQEPSYTSAILSKLHGIEIASKNGEYIKLEATDIANRGQGSAEYRYGADFAITATDR